MGQYPKPPSRKLVVKNAILARRGRRLSFKQILKKRAAKVRRNQMKTEKLYATTSFESNHKDGDDDTALQSIVMQRLLESNTILTYLVGKTLVALKTPGVDILFMQFASARVSKNGRMNFYLGPQDPNVGAETLNELKFMLDANTAALVAIENSASIADLLTFLVVEDQDDKAMVSISKFVIDDPPICPQCGDAIVYEDMADHVQSSACLSQRTKAAEEATGWQMLECEHEATLNKTKNVPFKMVAASYDMWTPKWVGQAIEFYQRNKGYAGLTLEEYLDKMADHQTK